MIREKNDISKTNRIRIYFLFILFLACFLAIIYRLVSIQYLNAEKYTDYAEFQHTGEYEILAIRGKILDRNGIEVASTLIEKTVYANPKMIVDPSYEAKILAEILGLEEESLFEKLRDKEAGFAYIKRKVSSEKAEELMARELPGIYLQDEAKRYYPLNEIAASMIGFTGTDNEGLSGIELAYESTLRGINGRAIAEKDVFGNIIPGNINELIEPIDGKDMILTIDSQIQYIAQERLEEIVLEYNALGAVAIVMNPNNGEIYAMASYPGFDPNSYREFDQELYKTQGISFTYEPGSTFKVINVASALEMNSIGKDQVFDLPPSIKVADRVIKEIFRTYNIQYSTGEIIQHSSNIGAVKIALSMGDRSLWEGIKNLGFGEQTGIELPGEEKGLFQDYKTWPASTIGALAIGQSISVTPLQLLNAVSTIANGGFMVQPHIVKEVIDYENTPELVPFDENNRLLRGDTALAVKDMMLAVVENGTGANAQIEGIEVCGKTGTAEKVNVIGRGYSEGRVITSFVGFAPYDHPEIAIIIVVDEPKGSENTVWGGTVAAPAFKEIMEFSLSRLKIFK